MYASVCTFVFILLTCTGDECGDDPLVCKDSIVSACWGRKVCVFTIHKSES